MQAEFTLEDMEQLAQENISNGYSGHAVVAWIDMLGFTEKILQVVF